MIVVVVETDCMETNMDLSRRLNLLTMHSSVTSIKVLACITFALLSISLLLFPGDSFAQVDTTNPTVSSLAVTSDPDDDDEAHFHSNYSSLYDQGVYGIGDEIQITVTFDESVVVTGSPQLELDVGGTSKTAGYDSASGGEVLFSYTVAQGDSDDDGISISANKLTLNGGSIKDSADNPANLAHSALAAQPDHEVDGIRPTITTDPYFASGTSTNDDILIVGERITAYIGFSEEVTAGAPHPSPKQRLKLNMGSSTKYAEFAHAIPECVPEENEDFYLCVFPIGPFNWRGVHLAFKYTIEKGDLDTNGVSIDANALGLNGGSIKDGAGNDAVLTHGAVADDSDFPVDGVPATVSSIEITSDPGSDNTYGSGDRVDVTVTMTEDVYVSSTYPPTITMNIGGSLKRGTYQRESAGRLVFSYTIRDGLNDDNGISFPENSVRLSNGETTGNYTVSDATGSSVFGSNYADLSFDAVSDDSGHKVATSVQPPESSVATLSSLTLSGVDIGTFESATTSYTADVSNTVTETTVSPTVSHSGASHVIKLGGVADADGVIDLSVGSNVITVEVTAEDGQTTQTYTVTVTRQGASSGSPPPQLSSDASLSALTLSGVNYGAFASGTTSYTAQVDNSVSQTTVTPTVNHSGATHVIKLGGVTDADGVIDLSVGSNVITVEVTAEDGQTTQTYTVTVTRQGASSDPPPPQLSSDASLSALTLSGVDFGTFASSTTSYTAQVANSVSQTTVTPTVSHSGASHAIKLGGVADADGVIDLNVGSNVITVEVTAEDGQTTQTYTVTVTRQDASPLAADPCTGSLGTLSGTISQAGAWADDCQSEVSGRGYARYYTFALAQDTEVTINLTSSVDTYLYLREDDATSGTALHDNDDIESGNRNSRIVATLSAGTYTIEATTHAADTTGNFTLNVSGGGQTPVATGCTPRSLTLPASGVLGSWADDCQSQVSGRGYARYYTFTLTSDVQATIDLSSSVDTYLYLREDDATSGTSLHSNDDIESGNLNSRIVATLSAGTYTVEATTYAEDTTGNFTLNVSGGGQTPVAAGCTPTSLTLPASGVPGSWADDCQSQVSGRGYARYYTFTLTSDGQVTIDLTSSVDTYLYLRGDDATSGTSLHSNDDIESGNLNSRIVANLETGTYTIEATTYAQATTGSFTLSVSTQ